MGSNIGLFTKYASDKCKKVISVEGSPEYFSCLVENTISLKNVSFLNANIIGSEINKHMDVWSDNPSIINVTMNDIFKLYELDRINFLKIDIEGGEYSLFNEMDDSLIQKIDKIAIETHPEFFPDNENINNELATKITKSGKSLYYFDWFVGGKKPTMYYFY